MAAPSRMVLPNIALRAAHCLPVVTGMAIGEIFAALVCHEGSLAQVGSARESVNS
jgi:hypothetical protein